MATIRLTGVIAYALRCAFLHNGDGEVGEQCITTKAKYSLGIKKVKFLANPINLATLQIDSTVLVNDPSLTPFRVV